MNQNEFEMPIAYLFSSGSNSNQNSIQHRNSFWRSLLRIPEVFLQEFGNNSTPKYNNETSRRIEVSTYFCQGQFSMHLFPKLIPLKMGYLREYFQFFPSSKRTNHSVRTIPHNLDLKMGDSDLVRFFISQKYLLRLPYL